MLDNMIAKFHDAKAKRANGEGGFTLIELLVVVVIIGILIAIAIPLYLNYQKGAKDKSAQSDLRAAVSTFQQCYSENGNKYPAITQTTYTDSFDLTCGTGASAPTEKVNLSDGTSLKVTSTVTSFDLASWNSGGKKDETSAFTYSSTTGGKVG